jgi:hypothetical protein
MLRFMIVGAPRSGTAWAANYFTARGILCMHDPLWDFHYADLDHLGDENLGISCTGIAYFPDWVNEHPCPKVILHRPRHEVQASLEKLGLPPCPPRLFDNLWRIHGMHVTWQSLFNRDMRLIHSHLQIEDTDFSRWSMLKDMRVTANYQARKQNPDVLKRLKAEGAFQ